MKKLLFLVLFALPMFCIAQAAPAAPQQKGLYSLVTVYRGLSKFEATIDDGSGKSRTDMLIKDAQGKTMKFNAVINIVNYVAQNGWSIITSYQDTSGAVPTIGFVIKRS